MPTQATATAVVLSAPGPLGTACTAELYEVLGPDATVVGVDLGAGAAPGAIADQVIGAGSSRAPVRWVVAVADAAEVGRQVLETALPRLAADLADRGSGRLVVVTQTGGAAGSLLEEAQRHADAAAIIGLSRSLARQLAARGVTVNVVRAGLIATGDEAADAERAVQAKGTPIRRLVSAEEVAAAVGHLVSPAAGYVNGIVLPVDGGAAMGAGT